MSKRLLERLSERDERDIAACKLAGDFVLWTRLAQHARLKVVPTVLSGFRFHGANRSAGGLDAYLSEVWANGGTRLPAPIARFAGWLFRHASAAAALRVVGAADAALHASVRGETGSDITKIASDGERRYK